MIRNQEVAALLVRVADLLETKGESTYRVAAYRHAAREIADLSEDIEGLWRAGRLDEIPGVGESIAAKIDEYLRTGQLAYLKELERGVAPGLPELLAVPGLGPHRVQLLHDSLGISTVDELARAAREHKLAGLPGFGEKLEANVLRETERLAQRARRVPLGHALSTAEEVLGLVRALPLLHQADLGGSIRRMKETIGDIDIAAAADQPEAIVRGFTQLPVVREVLVQGPTRASVLVPGNLQVDLRVVRPDVYGATLLYFTGSKEHNIALRERAIERELKLSEYGLEDARTGQRLASVTEDEVYRALGLPFIPPELRENRGEIEAAVNGRLPRLIDLADVRGDLHVHTDWSDGADSLDAMVEAARQRGYAYVAITDHSRGLGIAHGLSIERVRAQRRAIDELNRRLAPFRVLHGVEVNVRNDGRLDYPDDVLREFDLVAAAVHSGLGQPAERINARILSALRHPLVNVLCHPSGRLLGKRDGAPLDLPMILGAARERGVALEIDGQPDRLDLDDVSARRARDAGATLVLDSDAHAVAQLDLMRLAVAVARRAWVEPSDVLNVLELDDLLRHLARKRGESAVAG